MRGTLKLFTDLPNQQKLLVGYERFTKNVCDEIKRILSWLDMDVSDEYLNYLKLETSNQLVRNKGYNNQSYKFKSNSEYDNFFQDILKFEFGDN